jgi:hypothetical protein
VVFAVAGDPAVVLRRLFRPAADGHLRFGSAGVSVDPVGDVSAVAHGVEFRDYVLEGFVRYRLRAVATSAGLRVEVEPGARSADTPRERTIEWLVRFNFASGGLTAVASSAEGSGKAERDATDVTMNVKPRLSDDAR